MAGMVKNPPANGGDVRDVSVIPGSERCPGGGDGSQLQYSCMENHMDRWAWWATVHGVTESDTTEATYHKYIADMIFQCLDRIFKDHETVLISHIDY